MYEFLTATIFMQKSYMFGRLKSGKGVASGHLVGMIYRNLAYLESGVKPIWVFDGKPPENKAGELARRAAIKSDAAEKESKAKKDGDVEEEVKQAKRNIQVTQPMMEAAKELVKLLGIPVVQAKSEAEAQCVALVKAGKADAVVSEDLDALPLGAKVLLRKFKNRRNPAIEIKLPEALKELQLNHNQFIDLCILCGCDYTEPIKRVGSSVALKYIKKYGKIEEALKAIRSEVTKSTGEKRFAVPNDYRYVEARKLFTNPDVENVAGLDVQWRKPDLEGLREFLTANRILKDTRIDRIVERLEKCAPGVLVPGAVAQSAPRGKSVDELVYAKNGAGEGLKPTEGLDKEEEEHYNQ